MNLAPVILFVYNRPWHTEQTLNALMLNKYANKSVLYIYCDGPKPNAPIEEINKISEVRQIVRKKKWCKEIVIIERDENLGLFKNVIDGITTIVNKYGNIIVLEDDLISSPYFLTYCNEGLEMYKKEQNVYSINAFQFPLETNRVDTFLSPLATSSWGWATWKDRWNILDISIKNKEQIQNHFFLKSRFNFADYDYAAMLNNPKSWAIKWYYSVFLRNGLGLFPTKPLITNIGLDGSGENCGTETVYSTLMSSKMVLSKKEVIDIDFYELMLNYFTKTDSITSKKRKKNSIYSLKYYIKRMLKF
ncbi:glycosyltransferase family 2 protein [Flavivirga algicola]|uniref:Glycosyltransferase family 2 protein n=1 Tax=Flavivirga algicola TaxID=2729136 RepID=A0ABX1RT65_9FLAO|nr:glycosyltransferase family 2 protein [Flavivirga algicola]NMH86361.1 glycosyltransferase family 2 protein [Flavivirga algicola]